ncbi:MAG: carbohydrate binding domain-containing protein [Chitinispirillaceae bacterium]
MRKKFTIPALFCLAALVLSCAVQLKPSGAQSGDSEVTSSGGSSGGKEEVVYKFFDEDYVSGGYDYVYPDESKVFIPEESGKNGEVALQFDLIADDFSGGSVCLWNLLYDMTPYYAAGALEFWIKGKNGGEIAWAALVDDENTDGKKTVVRLPINDYGGIKDEWTKISIPLADFGQRGVFWDPKKKVEEPERFQWDKVAEFRLEIKKNDNEEFTAWVDDIFIVANKYEPRETKKVTYWDEREETLADIPASEKPEVNELHSFYDKKLSNGGFAYVYGGKTAYTTQPTESGEEVFTCYMDNNDYSGVTLVHGSTINAEGIKNSRAGGLAFWAKGAPNVNSVFVGLLDDESDGKKVQSKVVLGDYGKLDTTWKYFMIPVRKFQDQGRYWDDNQKAEVLGDMDWTKIKELRFSINKEENKVEEGEPVAFYVSDISFIKEIPGYVDPEDYWNSFESDAPEVMLHDYETEVDRKVEKSTGPKSKVKYEFVKSDAEGGSDNALKIDYKLGDWVDVVYNYKNNNRPEEHRDWTKHWGLKFNMYTEKPYQPLTVQVQDSGNEIFVAATGATKGWNEIIIPFKDFSKFPYYQPEDAEQNGKFDLDNVHVLDFKPAGEGSKGVIKIDNVRLTNDRVAKVKDVPEKVTVNVTGSDDVITDDINDGIFGINAALWDGDLLKPKTAEYVKPVNHKVIRYPGGLRADDDDWEEVLEKKDWMVDTDEFLEFCEETNTTPMITVNFGKGTPEKAAAWVEHVNKKKKANVKYWEVGNELYGDWHANQCSAEEYGKRAAEFIKQMKAVDPSIKVTVVWVLEGEWNKTVFEHTKDLADGVNVHHYPQHAGQENDAGLLASPQTLDEILPGVREQIEEYGNADKDYEIWLTEWNSVDFEPGPQTLTIVNGLFVADYLGKLTEHNLEQASYWDIHNDVTVQGGDYGYLSRTGAPDGDNVPRPSYWAFRMASESLGRDKLLKSSTDKSEVTSYLSENGKKSLMLVNKYPRTKAETVLDIPGFSGKATLKQLTSESDQQGPSTKTIDVKPGMKITLPAYSLTTITLN